jgi:hypothetical protein
MNSTPADSKAEWIFIPVSLRRSLGKTNRRGSNHFFASETDFI